MQVHVLCSQGSIAMKVKENMWERRGRPKKFQPGDAVEWRLRAPNNLLMELRVCARAGDRSVNDEIIARLLISLNYQPHITVIRTVEGERLISMTVKFEHWLDFILGRENDFVIDSSAGNNAHEQAWMWREGERVLIPGKTSGYSMRLPRIWQMKSELWRGYISAV